MVTVCVISDTHGEHIRLNIPKCDILIHCGDLTNMGASHEIRNYNNWVANLVDTGIVGKSIIIPGNHDFGFQDRKALSKLDAKDVDYIIENDFVEVFGLKIWGCSWVPTFGRWAFMASENKLFSDIYSKIPVDIDILVCHGPPRGILDNNHFNQQCGSFAMKELIDTKKINPRYYFCGHIHESRGINRINDIIFANAAIMDKNYRPLQPMVFDIQTI